MHPGALAYQRRRRAGGGGGLLSPAFDTRDYWLAKDYEVGTGIVGGLGSHTAADPGGANSPAKREYSGTPYLHLPGTAGNTASTPAPSTSPSTELEVAFAVETDPGTPAADVTLVSQYNNSGDRRAWAFQIDTAKKLKLILSADGTATLTTATSSVALGSLSAGDELKVTWRASDGRVQFFVNGAPLGTDRTAAIASIFGSTAAVHVGGGAGGLGPFTGGCRSAYHSDSIGGAPLASFDASDFDGTGNTADDGQGNTWTINTSASGAYAEWVGTPLVYAHTDDYLSIADHVDFQVGVGGSFTFTMVARLPSFASLSPYAERRVRSGDFKGWDHRVKVGDSTSLEAFFDSGPTNLPASGVHGLAAGQTHTTAIRVDRATGLGAIVLNGTTLGTVDLTGIAFDSSIALWFFRSGNGFGRLSMLAFAYHARALTDAQVADVGTLLKTRNAA